VQKRILIVEDEPAIRDMVAFALRKGEYEPIHAGDAREAQAAIADRVPDLILLDWMLPGASGLELARRWRKDPLTRERYNLPDEESALVLVFRTYEKISYGLIMTATRPVRLMDKVITP